MRVAEVERFEGVGGLRRFCETVEMCGKPGDGGQRFEIGMGTELTPLRGE